MTCWLSGSSSMKTAKADYYDPKLQGRQDGNDMESLPTIKPASPSPVSQPHVTSHLTPVSDPLPQPPQPPSNTTPTIESVPHNKQSDVSASQSASTRASKHESMFEIIRRAVRRQGKEVTYVRLTQDEKDQLADLIYTYKRLGIRTSETEISRIAINYLLQDYQANGKTSILACMLDLLAA